MVAPANAQVRPIELESVQLEGGVHRFVPILISAPFEDFQNGRCAVKLQVVDQTEKNE